jgi:outer membrane protein OmpA-like peptidoglycan-associated protein
LDDLALRVVAETARIPGHKADKRVIVTGLADLRGSALADRELSQLRAQVVSDGLLAGGVASQSIDIRIGEAVPSGDVIGRRVEVVIVNRP